MIKKKSKKTPKNSSKPSPIRKSSQVNPVSFFSTNDDMDLFHNLLNQIGDEVMILDKHGKIVFMNSSAILGLGYELREVIDHPIMDLFKEKISKACWKRDYFEQFKAEKVPFSFMTERIVKDGSEQIVDITATYMPFHINEYILTVTRNMTEQVHLQQKLQESEDRYRLLCEQAADGITMIDLDGNVLFSNDAAKKLVGTEGLRERKGRKFIDFIAKSHRAKAKKVFNFISSGKSITQEGFELKNFKTKESIPVEITASPNQKDGKIFQIHITISDMRKKKKFDSLIRETEKMRALQDFIAGTTREIQYPLKGLLDRTRSLINQYQDRAFEYIGYKEFKNIIDTLKRMENQTKECFETTKQLLKINRQKVHLDGRTCDVNGEIKEAIKGVAHTVDLRDIQFKSALSKCLPCAAIDAIEFRQIMVNLIDNAIQSLPVRGGSVKLQTSYLKDHETIRIVCSDDGVGIPKEVLPHVFDPFFTTKERSRDKNLGLGLSMVYSILQSHKASISITSNKRQGTTVSILIPEYSSQKSS